METDAVDSVGSVGFYDLDPALNIHRGMSGLGEEAAVGLTPE